MTAATTDVPGRGGDLRNYALVTGAYWTDTIADGAIRVLVLFSFSERGYRHIGFLGAQLDPRVMERLAGYRAALQQAGLVYPAGELLDRTPSSIGLGVQLLDRLLQQAPDCDALFCCNDDLAQGVLFECQRRGIRVPQQLAVAGFNDLAASAWINPRLTTIATPRYAIGHAAATMLLQRMEGRVPEPARIDLGYTLVVREST